MTPEGKVKDKVKKLLKQHRAWYFLPVSNGMGVHGIPDIISCVPVTITQEMVGEQIGLFVGIETKRDNINKVTPRQQLQLNKIEEAAGIALVINNELIDKLDEVLRRLQHESDTGEDTPSTDTED